MLNTIEPKTNSGQLKVRDLGIFWALIDQVSFNEPYLEKSTKK
jgi:hypothetical protein